MNSIIDAREYTNKYLNSFLVKNDFTLKLNKSKEAKIERKKRNGFDSVGIRILNYSPAFRISYGLNKVNFTINKIFEDLQKVVALNYKEEKNSRFLFFSFSTLNGINKDEYLPFMETESDVEKCVNMMIEFMDTTAFPLLEKFDDLREIDKVVNGTQPWASDWQMPYSFNGNFYEKRLIVAKLAGNPGYQQLIDFNYKTLERLSAENGHPFTYDRNDLSKPLPALIKLLEDVKPLY